MKKYLLYFLTIGIILTLWQIQAMRIGKPDFFPYPRQVWDTFIVLLSDKDAYLVILRSFARLVVAIGTASLAGVLLGTMAGFTPVFATMMRPVVTSLRTLPVASLIVIILILYGHTRSLYIITFLMIFPLVFEAAKQGVLNISKTLKWALLLEKVPWRKKMAKVYLPLAFPYIKTGFLQSIGLGFKVLVMAEFIAQSPQSIGNMLYRGRINLQYDHVFAWTAILIIIVTMVEFFIQRLRTET